MNLRTVTHTVLLLNIDGLTVNKLKRWMVDRDDGHIFWRNRLTSSDISANANWLIDYNR
jgi:hypothetical protein